MMITAHGPSSYAHTNTHGLSLITPRPSGTTTTRAPQALGMGARGVTRGGTGLDSFCQQEEFVRCTELD